MSREHWGTRIGMILAVAGSAVGLGNFLRFPGQAASNGGGAFMIPYFCALLFLGIPICWAEWTMGKYGGRFGFNSCPAIFAVLGRRSVWRYLGVLGLLIPIVIYMYYVLIESWCLGYAYSYLVGRIDLGTDPNAYVAKSATYFADFVGSNQDGLMLHGTLHVSVIVWIIVFTINFVLIYRGLSKGIEKFCKYAIPVMALCALIVLVRVLTLGTPNPDKPELNVLNGLGFMWNPHAVQEPTTQPTTTPATAEGGGATPAPVTSEGSAGAGTGSSKPGAEFLDRLDERTTAPTVAASIPPPSSAPAAVNDPSRVSNDPEKPWYTALLVPQTWLAAAGQIFFSLSVGFGVIINYASYLRRKDDVVLSGLTASATNEFFEVCLGGLITIPAAFVFLGVAGASQSGVFDLGFKTLPVVFCYMPGGRLFGFLWFFMLFLAAITSSLSMLQPAIAFLEEGLNIGRRAAVALLGLITAMGSLFVIYFSLDLAALNTMDYWIGTVAIVVLALVQVLLFAWFFGVERGYKAAMDGAELKLPKLFKFIIKYVAPAYLLFVLVMWCIKDLPKKLQTLREQEVPLLTVGVILAVLVFLLLLINIAGRRWKAETKDRRA